MSILMRLYLSVWCISDGQIYEILRIQTVHSKKVLTISSNFLDDTLCRKKIIMRDPSANGKEVKVLSTISAQNIGHGQL